MTEYRDWQPGDGLRCSYSRHAPAELPCGKPVRTAITEMSPVGRKAVVQVRALCASHAPGGLQPGQITTEARKIAVERLCAERWDEYQKYYMAAIEELRSPPPSDAR